jgi:integrative and conjugative element protein (TIGR02256 family)
LPFGHRAIARRLWRGSGGLTRYIGEWHTHPQEDPSPSSIDLDEWRKLAKLRLDERPLLAVIVGQSSLYVELTHGDGCRQIMKVCGCTAASTPSRAQRVTSDTS